MPTGQAIRERMLERRTTLGLRGKTTGTGSSTTALTDTVRFGKAPMQPNLLTNAQLRITSTSNSDRGLVAQVTRLDAGNGYIYYSPASGAAIASGVTFELWMKGIQADDVDRARDRALTRRCSRWQWRALSLLGDVAVDNDWGDSGASSARAISSMSFPDLYADKSIRITNSGANGYKSSPSINVQPGEQLVVFGQTSVRAQTASIRLRDITNGADITAQGTSTATLYGWQFLQPTFTVPASCGQVQVWLGGASASCDADWAGVGILPLGASRFTLPAALKAESDVGQFAHFELPTAPSRDVNRWAISAERERVAGAVQVFLHGGIQGPTYFQERRFYDALQTDYFSASDRTGGDDATTLCDLDYAEAATAVELLESMPRDGEMDAAYETALKDLAYCEAQYGPEQQIIMERTSPMAHVYVPRL